MIKSDQDYKNFISILNEELIVAMGCTEPIALAYAAAIARDAFGVNTPIESVNVLASASIIKNVKSVFVPNTNGLRGIPAAVAAGIVAGDASKELEVISSVTPDQIDRMQQFLKNIPITVEDTSEGPVFDIIVILRNGESYAKVRIANRHTNVVLIEHDGKVLKSIPVKNDDADAGMTDRTCLSMEKIFDFANSVDIDDVKDVLERQIKYNTAIADEGLQGKYGSNVGKTLLERAKKDNDVTLLAIAKAAAGSDARMNGCEKPVVINSGSGNQGITCSVPVIEFAKKMGASHEKLLRALVVSNLVSIHQKTGIGRLSAFCGAVCAGAGAGAGIAYLEEGTLEAISQTVSNSLATVSGMICDGAKASCASKIAMALTSAFLGHSLQKNSNNFQPGDGIVGDNVESTIANVGKVGHDGMQTTNDEIVKIMVES